VSALRPGTRGRSISVAHINDLQACGQLSGDGTDGGFASRRKPERLGSYSVAVTPRHLRSSASGRFSVIALFSGAGGASYGFHAHPSFEVVGAADAEIGKPSTGSGAIDCNETYARNIGIHPLQVDLAEISPSDLLSAFKNPINLSVLIACPPCTGFSRTMAKNHLKDDPRNSLVARVADFAEALNPDIIFLENARELINGKFTHHLEALNRRLDELSYTVSYEVHLLTRFGLPQQRERAILIATKEGLTHRTLKDLWYGLEVDPAATTVRRAISALPRITAGGHHDLDSAHTCTSATGSSLQRIEAIPHDGGSWIDLIGDSRTERFLTPAMLRSIDAGTLNHFCDIYGRMAWDRPAPTIKRECAHSGNGRYLHPEQDRLLSVREMALLQGFPLTYEFPARSRKNAYRHVGDAVPPLVSYQVAGLVDWILTGQRPTASDLILPGSHLTSDDLREEHDEAVA
jgi:DNA (cytosine-5)-methyltransferase 1